MQLETGRLLLLPLRAEQLEQWTEDVSALERALGCVYEGEPMTEEPLRGIVRGQLEAVRRDGCNWLWHTFWLVVRREDRVGGRLGGLQGAARRDRHGRTRLRAGGGPPGPRLYDRGGGGALRLGALPAGVNRVTAETEPDNAASQRVLGRCGFSRFRELPGSVWWELPGGGGARG